MAVHGGGQLLHQDLAVASHPLWCPHPSVATGRSLGRSLKLSLAADLPDIGRHCPHCISSLFRYIQLQYICSRMFEKLHSLTRLDASKIFHDIYKKDDIFFLVFSFQAWFCDFL